MTLHLGNSIEILPTLGNGVADAILTDMPYRLDDPGDPFAADNLRLAASGMFACIKPGGIAVVFHDTRTLFKAMKAFVGAGFQYKRLLTLPRPPNTIVDGWGRACETAMVFVAPGAEPKFRNPGPDLYGLDWDVSEHRAAKPLHCFSHIVSNVSAPGDTVLDPFMGSGTTGVACAEQGRKFVGIEVELKFYAMASDRITKRLKAA